VIKKIKNIHQFAVFDGFDWDTIVRDKSDSIVEFNKLNLLYGRNYSGKTTLSRILRTFEKGCMHEKYLSAQFELAHSGNEKLCHESLGNCSYTIRVYNKDFVAENLKWLTDEQGSIKPFAILGEKNIEIENEIASKEKELGNEEAKTGLRHDLKIKGDEHQKKQVERSTNQAALDEKLRRKALDDIKRNPLYNAVTYNITKVNEDIKNLKIKPRQFLTEKEIETKKAILKEQTKDDVQTLPPVKPLFRTIYEKSEKLLGREIKPTESIQDLLNDALLQEWVRTGIEYHKGKRTNCAFCGGNIPPKLWQKLDAHFSKESEELRNEINNHITLVEQEKQKINGSFGFVVQENRDNIQ
jgi:wobble nucleotide-excising tRNase